MLQVLALQVLVLQVLALQVLALQVLALLEIHCSNHRVPLDHVHL